MEGILLYQTYILLSTQYVDQNRFQHERQIYSILNNIPKAVYLSANGIIYVLTESRICISTLTSVFDLVIVGVLPVDVKWLGSFRNILCAFSL